MFEIKLLYISNVCPEEQYHEIFTGTNKPSQAGQKYHNLQIQGLMENGHKVIVLAVPAISRSTYEGLFFSHKTVDGSYYFAPILNVPVLRNLLILLYVFFFTLIKTLERTPTAVICDVLNSTPCMGALAAAFLTRTQTLGVVTDVPTKRAFQEKNPIKRFLSRFSYGIIGGFQKYVFLTQAMNALINSKGKPYLVAEGHVDHKEAASSCSLEEKYEKKVCLYAGSLRKVYGIAYLVQGFLQANVENSELHIYGAGDYAEELERIAAEHPSVKYFGVRPNSEIVMGEKRASLLINPRPTGEEYTQYSFPSKNMEYMVSGTPVLTTKLPGMPREYYQYVYLLEEENAQGLARRLSSVLGQSPRELSDFGQKAKNFVLEHKNNLRQSARLIELLESTEKEGI